MNHNASQMKSMGHDMANHDMSGHIMAGIPIWMAMLALAIIIIFSHLLLVFRNKRSAVDGTLPIEYRRFDILNLPYLKSIIGSPVFPTILQFIPVMLLFLIIVAGIYGSQKVNIAPVLTWTWWWALLIFIIVGFGKSFCAICPWEGLSSFFTSFSLRSRISKIGFDWKWPAFARNLYPALIMFIVLTWMELGLDITNSPSMTATLALFMTGMAILSAMLFEKRVFCRYVCLVGRVSGLYSLFAPIELRPKSRDICKTCSTKECLNGDGKETGCPLYLYPGALAENTYCTLCTKCIRTCPDDNIAINFRPPGTDLLNKKKFRVDEAMLAIVLLGLTSFHGLTMTPLWTDWTHILRVKTGLGFVPVFTALMILSILIPGFVFWFASWLGKILSGSRKVKSTLVFTAFAYALIPVALFYHLAHNGMHFFMEAQNIIPVLSDPFGMGWDIFGTAQKKYSAFMSLGSIWVLQITLIVLGHLYGVVVADKISHDLFEKPGRRLIALLPQMFVMIVFSSFSIWLIAQPMDMRSGM